MVRSTHPASCTCGFCEALRAEKARLTGEWKRVRYDLEAFVDALDSHGAFFEGPLAHPYMDDPDFPGHCRVKVTPPFGECGVMRCGYARDAHLEAKTWPVQARP